jgi:hypothetical protein
MSCISKLIKMVLVIMLVTLDQKERFQRVLIHH